MSLSINYNATISKALFIFTHFLLQKMTHLTVMTHSTHQTPSQRINLIKQPFDNANMIGNSIDE